VLCACARRATAASSQSCCRTATCLRALSSARCVRSAARKHTCARVCVAAL
jgi:hypothetical protein